MGFEAYAALEYEFFLFDETPQSVREKGYREPQADHARHFGYSVLRSSVHAEFYRDILAICEAMDMPLEGLHTETGAGRPRSGDRRRRRARRPTRPRLFKTFSKVLAQRRGWMATFMAKWSGNWPGQSGHHPHVALRAPRRQRRCSSTRTRRTA
jgi:glutamine synthetase